MDNDTNKLLFASGPVVEVLPRTRRDHGCDTSVGRSLSKKEGGGGTAGGNGAGRKLPQIPRQQSKVSYFHKR